MVYYNYTKKHGGIGGKTPAEAALINVDGRNKWITLIQKRCPSQDQELGTKNPEKIHIANILQSRSMYSGRRSF